MALTPEQAGHLLHPTRWWIPYGYSSPVLVTDFDGESGTFSMPVTETYNQYARQNRYTWLAVASVDSNLDPGVGGLFKMPDGNMSTPETWWGFEAETSSSTVLLRVSIRINNSNSSG